MSSLRTFLLAFVLTMPAVGAKRPNILFVMSDDHTLEAIGAYGSWLKDHVHTPNIDRLAAEGMRFNNTCCNNSICSPSRASIISGQYSHATGALNLGCRLKPDAPSYIVELQKAGYSTCVVGKWHMGQWPRGCDHYAVTVGQGSYFNPTLNYPDRTRKKFEGYYADRYADEALRWLKGRDRSKPFYLSLHFKGPHESFDYPDRWEHLHADVDIPEPFNLHEAVKETSPKLKWMHYSFMHDDDAPKSYYEKVRNSLPTAETEREKRSLAYQHVLHKYIRCVAALDENLGRVIDHLEVEGIKDETLIIYTSDQGYWLGQHGMFDKRLILETSLKMPLIVRYPGEVKAGGVNDRLAMNIDFGPTMLDYAGAEIPDAMQGASLRPLLRGEEPSDWRRAVFYAYYARAPVHWGIRTDRYKLIRFPDEDAIEFYDLLKDPHEMRNRTDDPDAREAIVATNRRLTALMKEVGVTEAYLKANMKQRSKAAAGSATRPKPRKQPKE
jgi:arylsulfatase A-like enzyme